MRTPLVLALALVAAACSTPEQRAQAAMQERMALYGPACERLGHPPLSDPWRACVRDTSAQAEGDLVSGYHPGWRTGLW